MNSVFIDVLVLLLSANGAPIVIARILGSRFTLPVDFGRQLPDGEPLFGSSKTWRGLAAAVVVCAILATFLGYGPGFGLAFGSMAMIGDLCSSFVKRRLSLGSGARFPGLDQLPEALLPSAYATFVLGYAWWWAVLLSLVFMLLAIVISKPLFWLKIRNRPH